ncbi:hypothetical protein ACE1ET_06735 [Saccharicrinis sp. FJH62]|uniref:hypothetical protein n=1 Tax=Saccharicrinis sp. FJH62 TaxID=3344657 RepID=UPI0035D4DD3F
MPRLKLNTFVLLSTAILLLLSVSCETDSDFTSINDSRDWQLNDDFSQKEKNLFDTLDFKKVAKFTEPDNQEYQSITGHISFYPNPLSDHGNLSYPNKNMILNIVIVDEMYNIKMSHRSTANLLGFDFRSYKNGYYRMYYVVQDSLFNIVHKGHGDIKKE